MPKRTRMAFSAAKFIYANRRPIMRSAARARNMMRRYVRRRRGRRLESAKQTNKQFRSFPAGTSNTFSVLDRKTLYAAEIRPIQPPNNNEGLRESPSMAYFLNGFKMCATFRNIHTDPIHVHMAIVQPQTPLQSTTPSIVGQELLVNNTSFTQRYGDFVNAATDAQWDRNQDCSSINQRKYNIYTHQRFILDNDSGSANYRQASFKHINRWMKVNRRFEYENTATSTVTKPLLLLIWYETLFPTALTAVNALEYNVNVNAFVSKRRV